MFKQLIILVLIILVVLGAEVASALNKKPKPEINYSPPCVVIYKTRKDYSDKVPVSLSEDKQKIVNYPAPSDVFYKGKLAVPTKLVKGYLLDNRGIGTNVAFLKYTYEEYSKLPSVPSAEELYKMIIDKDPLKTMYNLGNRYRFRNEVEEINLIIKNKELKNYKKLK